LKVVRPNPNNKDLGAILDGRMRKVGPEKIQKPKTQMNANLREMARCPLGMGDGTLSTGLSGLNKESAPKIF
jgi:hypothetical protein